MAVAARLVEGPLPSTNSGHSTELLKEWWAEDSGGIRGKYARAKPHIKAYMLLVVTSEPITFARKRACGCSPGASRTEGADSPAGIAYLHETCMRQRGVVPEMAELGRVYDGYCGGADFDPLQFSNLLRTYLIREKDCEVRNAFGEVVEVSAMCTRGPASQIVRVPPRASFRTGSPKLVGRSPGTSSSARRAASRSWSGATARSGRR